MNGLEQFLDRVVQGDALEVLKALPSNSVHCIVTSPPYYALRDYGVNGQIGLERTPAEYVAALMAVFEEARRILRDDGTMWVNLGDSYSNSHGGGDPYRETSRGKLMPPQMRAFAGGVPPKNLLGIPWRMAFALQDAGWILRSEIIWAKPNPMPESVTNRPTKAHETVFLLVKRERYFYDGEAIRESAQDWGTRNRSNMRNGTTDPLLKHHGLENGDFEATGRNKRTVWEVATEPTPFAHFATFPQKLIEPMILAGCPAKCCALCGAGWERVVEREPMVIRRTERRKLMGKFGRTQSSGTMITPARAELLSFRPTCTCNVDTRPGVVLDMFGGSGTVGLVARRLGRSFIFSDLNPDYCELARKRLAHNADSEVQKQEKGEWFTMPMFGNL